MKKKILIILLCGIFILGLTGCNETKNELEIGNKSDITISKSDVTMSIKDGTLTDEDTTLILKNKSKKILHYDEEYRIEIKKDKAWHKINTKLTCKDTLQTIKQNDSKEIELNWKNSYGKLPTGKYRIIKEVYFEKEVEQKFYISAEFNIDSN